VADLDMICATAPDSYHLSCDYVSSVTGRPYFGTPVQTNPGIIPLEGRPGPGVVVDDSGLVIGGKPAPDMVGFAECPPNANCVQPQPVGADPPVVVFCFPV